jgi:hypothetical protein
MFINRIRQRAASNRSALLRQFIAKLPRPIRVVDLGGGADMWQRWGFTERDGLKITLVNHHEDDVTHRLPLDSVLFISERILDAREIRSADLRHFDLVFSNSMLEHLPTRADQTELARKIVQCGRPYFVQVPNKYSLIDPHFPHPAVPFFATYPRELQARLLSLHKFGSGSRSPTVAAARLRFSLYLPLGRSDMRRLFPNAEIVTERSLGIPMSLVAKSA